MLLLSSSLQAGNLQVSSFASAKKKLEKNIYLVPKERKTLYCQADFDANKNISKPSGFISDKYKKRANRIEWEHVVPAENFGRNFSEWREGNAQCVNSKGQAYKGRRCAEKANLQFRLMQADMYNLYPAIGSVNASRRNYNFALLGNVENSFGSCAVKIEDNKVEPPEESRGVIARTYLYMDATYSSYQMSRQQRQLMLAWHKNYPVNAWECERAARIQRVQGNRNDMILTHC